VEPANGSDMYTRGFQFDDDGKAKLIALARSAGFGCQTCTGEGMVEKGFRAEVNGVITALAEGETPATLNLTSAVSSNGKTTFCGSEAQISAPSPTPIVCGRTSSDDDNTAIKVVSALFMAAIMALAAF
jgi:hypothetical protein